MKKIPTMFVRDEKTRQVINQITPGCEWVQSGEGIATRKWDGTCCLFKAGVLFKRYNASKSKVIPGDFIPAEGADNHWLGWRPVGDGPEDRWHILALSITPDSERTDGTAELVGPNINQNPDHFQEHCFRRHGDIVLENVPRDFEGLKKYLDQDIEGIVFHHPDGRMAKIKGKDFGLKRKP